MLAGRASQIGSEGDWIRFDAAPESILLTRSGAATHAFHNVCQHRGHRLTDNAGGCSKAFACPYHQWTYGIDGALINVPDRESFGPDLHFSERGLRPVAHATWNGRLYVHLGTTPPPLRSVDALFAGHAAVVLQGAVSPDRCARIVSNLKSERPTEHPFSPAFSANSIGMILDHATSEDEYFGALPAYRSVLETVDSGDLQADLLAALSNGLEIDVAPVEHPNRGPYGPSTLRRLPPGGIIPPHCEADQLRNPMHAPLRNRIDTSQIISWFLCLQPAESGGELALYDVGSSSDLGRRIYADRLHASGLLADSDVEHIQPAAGDLVVFNSGNHFHEILPVRGDRDRWTLGGFLCRTLDGGYAVFS